MEFLIVLLSALMGVVAPTGLVLERVAEDTIRDQLEQVEALDVRIDNTPSYQVVQGRVDRVRIAARGLYPVADVRIDTLEIETDAIALDPAQLRKGVVALNQPVRAGIRLVLQQDDLNRALQSAEIQDQLQDLNLEAFGGSDDQDYTVVDPQVVFLTGDRVRLQAILEAEDSRQQTVFLTETGLAVERGRQISLIDPSLAVNGQSLPPELARLLTQGIGQLFDLNRLEPSGITARLLKLEVEDGQMTIAAFVQVSPSAIASGN